MTAGNTSRNTPDRMELPVGEQPIHRLLVPLSIVCFAGAFVTDFVYWQTVAVIWETFSDWLLTVGMIIAGLAIITLLIDLVRGKQIRTLACLTRLATYLRFCSRW